MSPKFSANYSPFGARESSAKTSPDKRNRAASPNGYELPPLSQSLARSSPFSPIPLIAPIAPVTNEAESNISFSSLPAVGTYLRHYELIRNLGGGGMGQVFLARDSKLARLVAIKVLHFQAEELSQRFATEARVIAKCSHENIVTLHEAHEYEGIPYLVLEYLAGNTLRKVLEGYPEAKPMPSQRAVS